MLLVLRHALGVQGGAAAIWDRCHSSDSRAVFGTCLDPRLWLPRLGYVAALVVSSLLGVLHTRDMLQPLCEERYNTLMDTLSLALQVQVGSGCAALQLMRAADLACELLCLLIFSVQKGAGCRQAACCLAQHLFAPCM